ncbi:MAG: hypothetical protein QXU92_02815 [Candidatus Diapherotrites archaeon]
MNYFKLIVYGLWFGLIYFTLMVLGESLFPGTLYETAFTNLGIISVFVVLTLDTIISLGSAMEN